MEARCRDWLETYDGLTKADEKCSWRQPICPSDRPRRRNSHLSVSRMKLYEQCPAAYGFRYVTKAESGPREAFNVFGNLLHETLEDLFRWVRDTEHVGDLPMDRMVEIYRSKWTKYGMTGLEMYQEGVSMLRQYVSKHPTINHFNILAIEDEFNVQVGRYLVNGFIDRVDKVNDHTIRIIDYKSNRLLFSREEVDNDLQMSVYGVVAKDKWPWATHIEYVFHMLRHGAYMYTERSNQELDDCRDYVVALGDRMELDTDLRPRLNSNCCYCEYRHRCSMYNDAIAGKIEKVAYSKDDLASVALAHGQASKLAKIFYARQRELQSVLEPRLEEYGELEFPEAGMKYKLVTYAKETIYPVESTLSLVSKYTGEMPEIVENKILRVDNKKLDSLVDAMGETQKKKSIALRLELDNAAQKILGTKFDPRPIKMDRKPAAPKSGSTKKVLDIDTIDETEPS